MAYKTRRLNDARTRDLQLFLSRAESVQFFVLIPTYLRPILSNIVLSSALYFSRGLFPVGLPFKLLKAVAYYYFLFWLRLNFIDSFTLVKWHILQIKRQNSVKLLYLRDQLFPRISKLISDILQYFRFLV